MAILTKTSDEITIKSYFQTIHKLSQDNEQFPVDIDDVWMLVYKERSKAVRALKQNFIEGEDYTTFAQNGKTATGGFAKVGYKLSVSCMEYFIARKVRPIFEAYRMVFHKTVETHTVTPTTQIQALLQSVQLMAELEQRQMQNEKRTLLLENRLDRMERQRIEDTEKLLEAPLSEDAVPETSLRNTIRKLVNQYSNATGINQQDVWHSVYSDLYYKYGKSIKSYKKEKARDTNLDIAERNGLLPMIHAIISSKIQSLKQEYQQ